MKAKIFERPSATVSLRKRQENSYSPFLDAKESVAYMQEMEAISIGTDIAVTVIGTVVGQICVTAWPY